MDCKKNVLKMVSLAASATAIVFVFFLTLFSFITLKIGKTASDGIIAQAYVTEGTAISDANGFKSIRGSSAKFYLANDITLTNTQGYNENSIFSGTLYGNGKTITINMPYSKQTTGDNVNLGLLVGVLTGTIRDCNILLSSNPYLYEYTGSSTNYTNFVGIICGKIENGTIDNVTVTVSGSISYYAEDKSSSKSGGYGVMVGGIAGQSTETSTIKTLPLQ